MVKLLESHDTNTVKSGLQGRIVDLCQTLLPNGKNIKTHWEVGSLAGDAGQSLKVMLTRGDQGRWKDFASGESGNVLTLVKSVLYPNDQEWHRTLQWSAWWLGWAQDTPEVIAQRADEMARRVKVQAQEADKEALQKERLARRIFFTQSQDNFGDTPAESYLLARGINPALWVSESQPRRWPRLLRYCPELRHAATGLLAPALVAGIVTRDEHRVIAIHRIWLEPHEAGHWQKVQDLGKSAKMSLGRYKAEGGFIPLRRGVTNAPWSEPNPDETVHLTEGIEDAMVLAMALPEARIACAIHLSNIGNMVLHKNITKMVIWGDNDTADGTISDGLKRAVERQKARGLAVTVKLPPPKYKDLNDWLRSAISVR